MRLKLMISTNKALGQQMLNGIFNNLVWASDNMETVAHYYEGCVLEIEVVLNKKDIIGYVSCYEDISLYGITLAEYTYGLKDKMKYPANATWYSFSSHYLKSHLKSIKEIQPDLSAYYEEE